MNGHHRWATSKPRASLSAFLLGLAMVATIAPATAAGAAAPAAASPVEEPEDLDEIWVRGKLTANVVADAEDRYFRLMIMQRICAPEFLAYNAPSTDVSRNYSIGSSCPSLSSYSPTTGALLIAEPCPTVSPRFLTTANTDTSWVVPSNAVLQGTHAERAEYAENVVRITRGDPELLRLAHELIGTWKQMERIQAHYVKVRDEKRAARIAARAQQAGWRQRQRPGRDSGPRAQ